MSGGWYIDVATRAAGGLGGGVGVLAEKKPPVA